MFASFMCSVLSTLCWFSPRCANLKTHTDTHTHNEKHSCKTSQYSTRVCICHLCPPSSSCEEQLTQGNWVTLLLIYKGSFNLQVLIVCSFTQIPWDELNISGEISNVQCTSSSKSQISLWVIFLSERHNKMQWFRVPLWLLLMIFNINASITRALAAANILGAVPTSSFNNECCFTLIMCHYNERIWALFQSCLKTACY